jgi:hypothetical protein
MIHSDPAVNPIRDASANVRTFFDAKNSILLTRNTGTAGDPVFVRADPRH